MVQTAEANAPAPTTGAPAIIFSSDSHVGPRPQDLRPYCEAKYLEAYDEWAAEAKRQGVSEVVGTYDRELPGGARRVGLNRRTAGHYDMHQRLRDMDGDGVAAQAIFHGSQNGEPFPFRTFVGTGSATFTGNAPVLASDHEMLAVGMRIYNRWLADVCSIQPERHVGLAHVPTWDIEGTVAEIEFAREAGLRGVNWPAPKPGVVEFDDPAWEPCWAASEALGMHVNTHVGVPLPGAFNREDNAQGHALVLIESGGWPSRRGIGRMIFGGVFERHPDLKLVMTEQPGVWWPYLCEELDTIWMHKAGPALLEQVPKAPSEYFHSNVFIGASFMAHFEAEAAIANGFVDNLIWGSDYPHREGTWAYRERDDEPRRTHLALRDAFAGLEPGAVAKMVGDNPVDVFGLDRVALAEVARRIHAPAVDELTTPLAGTELDAVRDVLDRNHDTTHAFRTVGPWY